jgi:CheY-like chemotaxis protein
MGKKILTEAGYDVVAVSNGAAAVKKIAEQKPDIIILDVYMPGYTGLEVCEKVRGSMETLKTPVLLTVGKMEPYKPEEANRVRADGVIVKPFEASDLLAIVKKFEERISQASATPPPPRSTAAERHSEPEAPEPPEAQIIATIPQATVEVPDHMATSSAFSDLLSADSSHALGQFNANKPIAREAAPKLPANSAPIPDYELPVSWRNDSDLQIPSTMSHVGKDVVIEDPVPPPPPTPRPRQIPVYEDQPSARSGVDYMPTAAAPTGEIEVPREPHLQETAAEATRSTLVDSREPGLVPTMQTEAEAAALRAAELAPVETEQNGPQPVEKESRELAPGPRLVTRPVNLDPIDTKISESDFEARVAAAMASYNQAAPPQVLEEPVAESTSAAASDSFVAPASRTTAEANSTDIEERRSFDYLRPVGIVKTPSPDAGLALQANFSVTTDATPVKTPPETASDAVADTLATHLQAAAAAATEAQTATDHSTIAEAVHRVMERLKPELVEEIVKELKSKK